VAYFSVAEEIVIAYFNSLHGIILEIEKKKIRKI
jgi:hypothetical protein